MYHLLLKLSIFCAFIIVVLFSSSICTAYKRPYRSAFISNKISIHPSSSHQVAIAHRNSILCNNSPNNNDNKEEDNDKISTPSSLLLDQILKLETSPEEVEDPDGTPLFDTNNKRPTLFGLEPNYINDDPSSEYTGIDPLDNGLQFTGPIIMMLSIYVTLSLFIGDGMPL